MSTKRLQLTYFRNAFIKNNETYLDMSNFTKCLKNQPNDVIKMCDYPTLFKGFPFSLLPPSPSFL